MSRKITKKDLREAVYNQMADLVKDNKAFQEKYGTIEQVKEFSDKKFVEAFWFLHGVKL